MPRSTRRAVVVLAAAVLAAAGCGSGSGSTSGDTSSPTPSGSGSPKRAKDSIDVCKIITPADAEKVVGGPVESQPPATTEGLASGVCIYRATGGGIRVGLLQVRVYPGPQFYGEDALGDTESIEIEGADKAFERSAAQGKTIDVQFVKDGKTGTVNYTDTGSSDPEGAVASVEQVAQKLADGI